MVNLQNDKKSDEIENSVLKDYEPDVESIKASGIKRPQQTPTNNKGNLVYGRRKTESEHHKNNNCIKPNDQRIKPHEHDEKNHEQKKSNQRFYNTYSQRYKCYFTFGY